MFTVTRLWLILALSLTWGAQTLMAEPIGIMERYVLAADREAMLAELIPGSDDYYFFHCLHYQTTGQLEKAESIIKDWLAENKGRETALITAMLDRQRLLTYNDSPERTIDHLVRRLGVKLDHAPPAVKGERRYPSQLDVAALDVDRLVKEALQRNDRVKVVGMQHLAELFRTGKTAGLKINLQEFLKRVDGAYISDLDQLVSRELNGRADKDRRFGDLQAHQVLTLKELQNVAAAVKSVSDDNAYVQAVLRRLRPDGDSDPSQQPEVQLEYLKRVEAYVATLPASYNSLKAASAYRLLEANLAAGVYDRELFMRYLQLPRSSPIVHPIWARRPQQKANLSDNFMDMALLPPIGNEQPLVRTYLEHFLKDAANPDAFGEYLQPEYLRRVFAETKLLYGVGSEDQWYKMLDASQRQAIRDAVELRLSPENKRRYGSDDPTELIVDVKNIDDLVVRIYEINTLSYYRSHNKPLDTDIDLDGLRATHERNLKFNQPAVQRHREVLKLDEISGRGVWIVDLVGKGLRARAMIRRGEIHHVDATIADGMLFTIIDENRQPIAGATMLVGSREFIADDQGRLSMPPVVDRLDRRAIISDGKLAEQVRFRHLREIYRLTAGMHLDRTQLQSGGTARLLIRPRLTMADEPIDPATLSDISVRIQATDLENLSTTHEIEDVELDQSGELAVPFRVPARLAQLNVTLSGTVTTLATSQEQTLRTSRSWDIAGIRRTNHTHDAFLGRDGENYVIDVRGRTGELVAHATVSVSLQTEARNAPVEQTLQSDENGRVHLRSLPGVTRIRYGVPSGLQHERDLELDRALWPAEVHTTTDRPVRLALGEDLDDVRSRYRLLEVRGGNYHVDHTDKLSVDQGLLAIDKLPAGDYQLIDRTTAQSTQIVVVKGPVHGLVAAGEVRHRSISPSVPVGIASITRGKGAVKIQLSGETKLARVHVYGSRYFDRISPLPQLMLPFPRLYGRGVALPRCGYVGDLRLGDEYQYVLRRRYAAKYPGVMLPQPSVILNPWETEETVNVSQSARAGAAPPPSAAAPKMAAMDGAGRAGKQQAQAVSSDFDFLADPGFLVVNLRADKNGLVTIPADVVEGLPILQIIVSDPVNLLQRVIAAPMADVKTVDLRLAKALDADKPLSFERAVSIVSKQEPLDLESLGSAQLQVYGTFGSLMTLYKTLIGDGRLADFDELAVWHTLEQDAKLDAYSRLASHELHLFLWSYDRDFFDEVVRPYLENKKEKQFIDHWLLESDLSAYTTLWRYNQLNAAERALLALRLPEVRDMVRRELTERVAQQDENYQAIRMQIESALKLEGLMDEKAVRGKLSELRRNLTLDALDADGVVAFGERDVAERYKKRKSQARELEDAAQELEEMAPPAPGEFGGRMGGIGGGGFAGKAFYRELDSTKQWAESHWDRVRTVGGPPPASLIDVDPFWMDLANGDLENLGVSSNLLRPVGNRHSALVALAMCGLPLEAGEIGLPTEPNEKYAPQHAVAVVTKRLKLLEAAEAESSILVGQRFARLDDILRGDKKKPIEEPTEFLIGVAYQGQTVISNPTAERRIVDVFWQIPAGSMPLGGSQTTDSRTLTLEPFAVQAIQYQFYFPRSGQFVHYPATVAVDGKLISRGTKKQFNVVDEASEDDRITWEKIARTGTPQQITEFLAEANLRELDWMLVVHRMQDQDVYRVIIKVLDQANMPINDLWAYSLKHRDEAAIKAYLSLRDDLVARVGPLLSSPLLEVEPIQRRMHEHLEYAPLVRARIHRLGDENEILNPTFLQQYRGFVRVLGFTPDIAAEEQLVLTYYLLLQNRIEEAVERFADIERDGLVTRLQYDYVDAYLAMHREEFGVAEKIARQYSEYAIPRWKNRFGELALQLNQRRDLMQVEQLVSVEKEDGKQAISEGSGDLSVLDRERRQESAADQEPEVVVAVEGDSLRIDHRRAKNVTLNLYGVDLELLFSKAPFVREDLQRMAMVRPMRSEQIDFDNATGSGRFELDGDLRRQTLLVEVVAGASRSTALYYGGEITTYVSESYGQLQTTDTESHRPISTAYVKVYARYPNGDVRFYKDGYTDSRGRFDYTSISANDAKGATRFAILVLSDEKGATLHDVAPPTQ